MSAVVLLEPERMRARRRPLAVLGVWLVELAIALVVATPIHGWARAAFGAHPDGDAVLWAPGAGDLLAWLGSEGPARTLAARSTAALLLLGLVLVQLPLGAMLASLAFAPATDPDRAPRGAFAAAAAVRSFRALGSLLVLGRVVQLLVLGAFALPARTLGHALEASRGDGPAFTTGLVITAFGVLFAAAVGALLDVARAGAVQAVVLEEPSPVRAGLRAVWRARGPALRSALVAWSWRAALGLVSIGLGATVADRFGGRPGTPLVVLAIVHQGVSLARTALRASWLARASAIAAAARELPEPVADDAEPAAPQARANDL